MDLMSFKDFISNFVIIELGKSVTLTANIQLFKAEQSITINNEYTEELLVLLDYIKSNEYDLRFFYNKKIRVEDSYIKYWDGYDNTTIDYVYKELGFFTVQYNNFITRKNFDDFRAIMNKTIKP